jgi:hypothetical protein
MAAKSRKEHFACSGLVRMTRKCPAADLTTEATAAPEVITRHDTRRDTGACSSLNCRSVARPDGLQASTLQRAAHRHLNAIQRKIHRRLQGMMLLIHDNTRQAAQDHLDAAALVDTATLGVHVFDAHADPFDWPCKLAKLAAVQPAPASAHGLCCRTGACGVLSLMQCGEPWSSFSVFRYSRLYASLCLIHRSHAAH